MNTVLIEITQRYLAQYFTECNIVQTRHMEAPEDLCFEVRSSEERYFLRIQKEVLDEQKNTEDFQKLLENYRVANTMLDLGDFPVVVTTYGCMFGSP